MTRDQISDVLDTALSQLNWGLNSQAAPNGIDDLIDLKEWVYKHCQPPQMEDYDDAYDHQEALNDYYENKR